MNYPCIVLLGPSNGLDLGWKEPFFETYHKRRIYFYDPIPSPGQVWTDKDIQDKNELIKYAEIVIYAIPSHFLASQELVEIGFCVSRFLIGSQNRDLIIYVSPTVEDDLIENSFRMAIESNMARSLILDQIAEINHRHIHIAKNLEEALQLSLDLFPQVS